MKKQSDRLPGGLSDNQPDNKYDEQQIQKGMAVEKEHTPDPEIQKEITKDHLEEIPDYYSRLDKMEEEAKKELKLAVRRLIAAVRVL